MRISDWSSDVCSSDLLTDRFLIFLQAFVYRVQQGFQILPRGCLAFLEARLGAFEERFLRTIEHDLPDLAELRGERGLCILELRDLRVVRRVARALFAEQGRKLRSEEHTSELQSLMRISYAV